MSTLGAVLLVGVFSDKLSGIGDIDKNSIVGFSLLALPIISFIIDVKMLEFSLHIKTISTHITQYFADKEADELQAWERTLWNRNPLSTERTFLTIFSSVGLSSCILVSAGYFAWLIEPGWSTRIVLFVVIAILALLMVSLFIIPRLLK